MHDADAARFLGNIMERNAKRACRELFGCGQEYDSCRRTKNFTTLPRPFREHAKHVSDSHYFLWSQIIQSPSRLDFRDPGSRSQKLLRHRCAPHKSRKPAAGQVFLSFVRRAGLAPAKVKDRVIYSHVRLLLRHRRKMTVCLIILRGTIF